MTNNLTNKEHISTLESVSDRLYKGNTRETLDFDAICSQDSETCGFKMVDTLIIHDNILYLIEFKKCDLFYQDIDAFEENEEKEKRKKIDEIIKKASGKIENCLLVQLPHHLKNYKGNKNIRVKGLYVLGDKSGYTPDKNKGRMRAIRKLEHFKKLEIAINKYKDTPYYMEGRILDKNEFLDSEIYSKGTIPWEYL